MNLHHYAPQKNSLKEQALYMQPIKKGTTKRHIHALVVALLEIFDYYSLLSK